MGMMLRSKLKKQVQAPKREPELASPYEERTKSSSMQKLLAILFIGAYFYKNSTVDDGIVDKIPSWAEDAVAAIFIDNLPLDHNYLDQVIIALLEKDLNKLFSVMPQIGKSILQIDKGARHNLEFSRRDLDILSAIGRYFRNTSSESSWQNVFKSVDLLGMPEVSMMYAPSNIDTEKMLAIKKRMRSLVRKLLDDPESKQYMLKFQQATQFTSGHKKRAIYEKYMVAQRELRAEWNKAALSILRRENKPMKVEDFEGRMASMGVNVKYIPIGFNAKIGLNGKKIELFTNDDKPIYGWPMRGRKVRMNPRYGQSGGTQFVFKAVDAETGKENQYYTYDHHNQARTEKFKMVETVMEDIESYKNKWEAPLKAWKPNERITLEVIQSAQAYFMYETQARIGGRGNKTGDTDTFGVTTWKVGHIKKLESEELRVSYSGKKAVKQVHKIIAKNPMDRKVIKLVKKLSEGKAKKDDLWMVPGLPPSRGHASAALFRKWLKSIGFPSTPHKLRHAKGTKIAKEIMAKELFKPDETKSKDIQAQEAAKFFKEKIAKKVALALGHKSADGKELVMTSVKSYIDPIVSKKWFTDNGFRPPRWIPSSEA